MIEDKAGPEVLVRLKELLATDSGDVLSQLDHGYELVKAEVQQYAIYWAGLYRKRRELK